MRERDVEVVVQYILPPKASLNSRTPATIRILGVSATVFEIIARRYDLLAPDTGSPAVVEHSIAV